MRLSLICSCLSTLACNLVVASAFESTQYDNARELVEKRFDRSQAQYLTPATAQYYIAGNRLPDVDFDVGESYSGLMAVDPQASAADMQKFFFWFFPTVNPAGKNDIVIWFNGGPGCSSMEGFMQENGPIQWKYGTYKPKPNAFSWHKLANIIWVEYPIGTGFSNGPVTAFNNDGTAAQFVKFWKNFMQTFNLNGKRIYLSGESYAGIHVPYVGAAMLDQKNNTYFNVKGALYYDPVMPWADGAGFDQATTPAYARYWQPALAIPQTAQDQINDASIQCGHDEFVRKHLTYPPPPRPFPTVNFDGNCDVVTPFNGYTFAINPCFNPYHVTDTCPVPWDILGYPGAYSYTPEGATVWFNDPAVRRIIGVPSGAKFWSECQGPVFAGSGSDNYNNSQHELRLRTLLESTNNVIVGSGIADYVIQPNVTALSIQALFWNGKQGFQTAPTDLANIPFTSTNDIPNLAGGGVQGIVHTERGLTWTTILQSGHMVPQYAPSVALRHLEVLLGRTKSLQEASGGFSITISNNFVWPF